MAEILRGDHHLLLCGVSRRILPDVIQIIQVFSHHCRHQLHSGKFGNRIFTHEVAVPKHRDPVADRVDLLQEMRHENDPDTLVAKTAHQHEQLLHFLVIQ